MDRRQLIIRVGMLVAVAFAITIGWIMASTAAQRGEIKARVQAEQAAQAEQAEQATGAEKGGTGR